MNPSFARPPPPRGRGTAPRPLRSVHGPSSPGFERRSPAPAAPSANATRRERSSTVTVSPRHTMGPPPRPRGALKATNSSNNLLPARGRPTPAYAGTSPVRGRVVTVRLKESAVPQRRPSRAPPPLPAATQAALTAPNTPLTRSNPTAPIRSTFPAHSSTPDSLSASLRPSGRSTTGRKSSLGQLTNAPSTESECSDPTESSEGEEPVLKRSKAVEQALRREAIGQDVPVDRRERTAEPVAQTFTFAELEERGSEKQAQTIKKRNHIFQEIVSTEQYFVRCVQNAITYFLVPLRAQLTQDKEKAILSGEELGKLFSNLEVILPVNAELLKQLEERQSLWPDENDSVGDIFLTMTPYLKLYSEYEKATDTSRSLITQLKENDQFLDFEYEQLPHTNQLDLEALLIMPVQRIPRYRLLLEDLLKNTWVDHADYSALSKALEAIKIVAKALNDDIRAHESNARVQEISETLKGCPSDLVAPHRFFVKEGSARVRLKPKKAWRDGQLYFLNDLLVVGCSRKCKYALEYFHTWVRLLPQEKGLAWVELWCANCSVRLLFKTKQEQASFVSLVGSLTRQVLEVRPMLEDQRIVLFEQLSGRLHQPPVDLPALRLAESEADSEEDEEERKHNEHLQPIVFEFPSLDRFLTGAVFNRQDTFSICNGTIVSSSTAVEVPASPAETPLSHSQPLPGTNLVSFKRGVLKEGYLTKQGGTVKSWKRRWFVLRYGHLYYYKDDIAIKPLGDIVLQSITVDYVPVERIGRPYCFRIATRGTLQREGRDYFIFAESLQECETWVAVIRQSIRRKDAKWLKEGWLLKKEKTWKKWRLRWWTMDTDNIYYFKNDKDDVPSGSLPLLGTKVKVKEKPFPVDDDEEQDKYAFSLTHGQKSFFVAGQSAKEREEWTTLITAHTNRTRALAQS